MTDSDSLEKRHRHHRKHKHKKHKKHKRSNKEPSDAEGGSTEQEIELDHVEYSMDMTEETVTVTSHEHFIMNAEHCEVGKISIWHLIITFHVVLSRVH